MPLTLPPVHHLKVARGLLSGAAVSLEHVLAATNDASMECRLEQQFAFIVGELRHAVAQMESAAACFKPAAPAVELVATVETPESGGGVLAYAIADRAA